MAGGNKAEKQFQGYQKALQMQGENALRQQLMTGLPSDNEALLGACDAVIEQLKSGTAEGFAQKWQEFTDHKKDVMQHSEKPLASAHTASHRDPVNDFTFMQGIYASGGEEGLRDAVLLGVQPGSDSELEKAFRQIVSQVQKGSIDPDAFQRALNVIAEEKPAAMLNQGMAKYPKTARPEQTPHGDKPAPDREAILSAAGKARAGHDEREMAALVGNGTATLNDGSQVNAESLKEAIKASGVSDANAAKLYRHAIQAVETNNPAYFQGMLDQHGSKIGLDGTEKTGLMNQVSALVQLHQQQPSMERRGDPPANTLRTEAQQNITSRDELNKAVGAAIPPELARALIHDDGTPGAAIVMDKKGTPQTLNLLDGLSEKEKSALQRVVRENGAQEICAGDSVAPGCFVPYTPKKTQNNR